MRRVLNIADAPVDQKFDRTENLDINPYELNITELLLQKLRIQQTRAAVINHRLELQTAEAAMLREELRQKDEHLVRISHLQGHSVRRPLANILGLVNLADSYKTCNTEADLLQLFELLKTSAKELDDIIKNIASEVD
jgi:signal transduction histidine kinase